MKALTLPVLALLAAAGCADMDGDGLSDRKENRLGTRVNYADSDQDGVSDGDEVDMGLDPTNPDFDGDGYLDGDEIARGTDPMNPRSVIYEGGWPFNGSKGDIEDPGFNGRVMVGDTVPNFIAVDQFGEQVELYDFAGQGKPVMIDISAEWCPPCRAMANWMDGGNSSDMAEFNAIREAVDNGDMYWVTIIAENRSRQAATPETAVSWYDDFPHPNIPVLADEDYTMVDAMNLQYWPNLFLLDEDMTYVSGPSSQSWAPPMYKAMAELKDMGVIE